MRRHIIIPIAAAHAPSTLGQAFNHTLAVSSALVGAGKGTGMTLHAVFVHAGLKSFLAPAPPRVEVDCCIVHDCILRLEMLGSSGAKVNKTLALEQLPFIYYRQLQLMLVFSLNQ